MADYGCNLIKLFHRQEIDKKNRIDLVVIKWNAGKAPVLENRRSYLNKDGEWSYRKQAGMGCAELAVIRDNMDEIMSLLQTKHDHIPQV